MHFFFQSTKSFLSSKKRHESELPGLRPLPKLRKVHIPPPLNGKQFGDIIMVSEFIDTFKKFLQTDENFPLKTGNFIYWFSIDIESYLDKMFSKFNQSH